MIIRSMLALLEVRACWLYNHLKAETYTACSVYLDHLNLYGTADNYCQINSIACRLKGASDFDLINKNVINKLCTVLFLFSAK
jgi:hypothetical protein